MSDQVRVRFGELLVASFVRAIDALNTLPKGPELAMRRVWADKPPLRPTDTKAARSPH